MFFGESARTSQTKRARYEAREKPQHLSYYLRDIEETTVILYYVKEET